MEIGLAYVHKTPVLTAADRTANGSRVRGATMDGSKSFWRFPAFPPFIQDVLHDLEVVYKDYTLTPDAQAWLESLKTEAHWVKYAFTVPLPGPHTSYDHQLVGLGKLLYNYRYILQWEMGTGKTKPIIDLAHTLNQRVMVLCPLVAATNWVQEVHKHSLGRLQAHAITGTREKKLQQLNRYHHTDVLVVTYDVARLYGIPSVSLSASKVIIRARGYHPPDSVSQVLSIINDTPAQTRLAEDWLKGRDLREIRQEATELAGKNIQWLSQLDYDIVVADEAHRIKRLQSQRTQACLALSGRFPRRYLLSGTLSLGDPRDLYPQLKFLAPYLLPLNYSQFCDRYVVMSNHNKHMVVGYKNLDSLNAAVTRVSDRRELSQCVDLPERTTKILYFELGKQQQKNYNEAVDEMMITHPDPDASPLDLQNGAVRLNKLLQVCSGFVYSPASKDLPCDNCARLQKCVASGVQPGSSGCIAGIPTADKEILRYEVNPKLALLDEFLDDLLEESRSKVIIWANYTAELDDIETMLAQKKVGHVRVDGSNSHNMSELVNEFQTHKGCRIFLGQIKTGIAITLTAAQYTIYYSRSWSLEDWLQSRNRNYRIGQTEKTVIYHLCGRGTVEEQQLTALEHKKDVSTTLTKHVNCMTCSEYSRCAVEGTEPWTGRCIFDSNTARKSVRVRVLKEK